MKSDLLVERIESLCFCLSEGDSPESQRRNWVEPIWSGERAGSKSPTAPMTAVWSCSGVRFSACSRRAFAALS